MQYKNNRELQYIFTCILILNDDVLWFDNVIADLVEISNEAFKI